MRRWRGEMCERVGPGSVVEGRCETTLRSLRDAKCSNTGEGLLDTLRQLDCLSFNTSPHVISSLSVILVALVAIIS